MSGGDAVAWPGSFFPVNLAVAHERHGKTLPTSKSLEAARATRTLLYGRHLVQVFPRIVLFLR